MTKPLLADAFAHHVWATDVLLAACEALEPAALETTVPGTFGSIIETLRHTVGADASYLTLLSGGQMEPVDETAMGLADLRAVMAQTGPIWQSLLEGDLDPDVVVTREREDGSTSSAPLGVRLAQAIHHGTDHRSQVCTALTALGVEPPEIDVWAWAWGRDLLAETPPTG